jgi:hypothetical protein
MSEETANEKDEQEKEHLRGEVLLCGFITKALLAKTQVYYTKTVVGFRT